jgi:hypothetical protein
MTLQNLGIALWYLGDYEGACYRKITPPLHPPYTPYIPLFEVRSTTIYSPDYD